MDDSQLQNKEKLAEFVKQLRKLSFPSSPISIPLADYVATALESYLSNNEKSLDTAFGVNPKRGVPGFPRQREELARKAIGMKIAGNSWKEIADKLDSDERKIRRVTDEFKTQILSEYIKIDDLIDE
jgi:hypothetical protein